MLQDSLVYVVNGIMMLLSFFACRVMLFPILYWWYSTVMGLSLISTIIAIPCWVHAATFSLWLPQLFWFNKMLKGSLKVMRGRNKLREVSGIVQEQMSDGDIISRKETCRNNLGSNFLLETKGKMN